MLSLATLFLVALAGCHRGPSCTIDLDGDGAWSAASCAEGTDCDDMDSGDHPGVTETVDNGDDEDCDGGDLCYDDGDDDGYLDGTGRTRTCCRQRLC